MRLWPQIANICVISRLAQRSRRKISFNLFRCLVDELSRWRRRLDCSVVVAIAVVEVSFAILHHQAGPLCMHVPGFVLTNVKSH